MAKDGHVGFISRSKGLFAQLRDPLPPVTVLKLAEVHLWCLGEKWEFTVAFFPKCVALGDFKGFYMVFWEQAWMIWIYVHIYIFIDVLCGSLIETSIVTLQHESWWVSHALPTSTGNQRCWRVDSTAAWWFVASVRRETVKPVSKITSCEILSSTPWCCHFSNIYL